MLVNDDLMNNTKPQKLLYRVGQIQVQHFMLFFFFPNRHLSSYLTAYTLC